MFDLLHFVLVIRISVLADHFEEIVPHMTNNLDIFERDWRGGKQKWLSLVSIVLEFDKMNSFTFPQVKQRTGIIMESDTE